eukprot:TRINITY_DN4121_c0_g1::TRINITY_DN4121_c0_g1_i1::g.2036::m.2036 TRINITY_DN4121_c0_g1::TRINITY_DN4121_c0_g1_i1::g.2036  ORF type:complete len:744 (-),score=212.48,sp/D3ZGS3/OCRL_RAT/38.36/2e-146,Exo_endo_phos/PF03372.18/6.1e-26,RhoGAP/PF00620.22/4e+03,RhoGAP/PF00620.22/6.7e-10 TRINITY_DN4121_c0_g1_i1:37-2190(-)
MDPALQSTGDELADRTRTLWLKQEMKKREKEFTQSKSYSIFVGTWNVNAKKPQEKLEDWLKPKEDEKIKPDFYVVGFQEVVELAGLTGITTDETTGIPWRDLIQETLGGPKKYVLIGQKQLVGILVFVFARKKHVPLITGVVAESVGVGILGKGGNKGASVVRFRVQDTTICCVCSHLSARDNKWERRNEDYREIMRRVEFITQNDASSSLLPGQTIGDEIVKIEDHDYIVWLGDLNYRINLPFEEVYMCIQDNDLRRLLQHDQLIQQKDLGQCFDNFTEAEIKFLPTYKFCPGSDEYDSREEGKKRTPAFCDRILWRAQSGSSGNIKLLAYRRHELKTSDHRPVSALLEVAVMERIKEKQRTVYRELIKQLDQFENNKLASVAPSCDQFDFGVIRYGIPETRVLSLRNTGQVFANFQFIPKANGSVISKPWLHIEPSQGIVTQTDPLDIKLTIHVDRASAPGLNLGADKIEDVLILHLRNGRDYFISLSGQYQRSCFGTPLGHLLSIPWPIRCPQPSLIAHLPKPYTIPKELWRLVDYLLLRLAQEDVHDECGDNKELAEIREALDTGTPFMNFSSGSVMECILQFLHSLPEPVVPYQYYQACLDTVPQLNITFYHQAKQVVDRFDAVHYNCFIYLVEFMKEVIRLNVTSVDETARMFAGVMLRPPPNARGGAGGGTSGAGANGVADKKSVQFLLQFLRIQEVAMPNLRQIAAGHS